MSGTLSNSENQKPNPATAPGEGNLIDETSEPRNGFVVKENLPFKSLERRYTSIIKNRVLLGLLDYCRDNKTQPGKAIVDLVEFRLVQLGYLPEWWFERKRI